MTEQDTTPRMALVAYILTHALLKSFIDKAVLTPAEAHALIDHATLILETLHGAAPFEQVLLEAALADLEATLSMLPELPN